MNIDHLEIILIHSKLGNKKVCCSQATLVSKCNMDMIHVIIVVINIHVIIVVVVCPDLHKL